MRDSGHRPAAVDRGEGAGRIGALVARQIQSEIGDLLRAADPAHWLARDECGAGRGGIAGGGQPLVERRRLDRAGADGVAAYAATDIVERDRSRDACDRTLGRAISET